jgi:hypothetical protein
MNKNLRLFSQSLNLFIWRELSSTVNVAYKVDSNVKLGFIGFGKIAQAVILGLINKDIVKSEQIYVNDSNKLHLRYLQYQDKRFKVS